MDACNRACMSLTADLVGILVTVLSITDLVAFYESPQARFVICKLDRLGNLKVDTARNLHHKMLVRL